MFPNPTSGNVKITFELQRSSEVRLSNMDINVRLIARSLQGHLSAGQHTLTEDFSGKLSQGMYFITLQTEQGSMTQKLTVL